MSGRQTQGILCAALALASYTFLGGASHSLAQNLPPSRITQVVDDSSLAVLRGNVNRFARAPYDQGAAPSGLEAKRMLLALKRGATQEALLRDFLLSVNDRTSPNYHKFVNPDDFAKRFGPAPSDVAAVTSWLESRGLTVNRVLRGNAAIEFSGTVGQVQAAFHTPIHRYVVHGKSYLANANDPSIPAALAPVVAGVARMTSFKAEPQSKIRGAAQMDRATHKAVPLFNDPVEGGLGYYIPIVPGDFNTIYDLKPLLQAGINGSGVTIAIVGDSNVDTAIVDRYRSTFGLPANTPTVVVDGTDPGINGDATEAYLDLELAGAVAPNAAVRLYVAADTTLGTGLDIATVRAVTDNIASIVSISYGACEQDLGATENAFLSSLFEQAAAQGITVVTAAGDAGSAGCDDASSESAAVNGLAVNGYASTPYSVAVGGTDFFYSNSSDALNGTYWNAESPTSPNNNTDYSSALQYIPEMPWNDSYSTLNQFTASGDISGGGGGKSSCSQATGTGSCSGAYAKPAWQIGPGVPADGVRDLPDVSLFAGDGLNYSFYAICAASTDCPAGSDPNSLSNPIAVTAIGGTSAAAPAFAGILALAVQKYGLLGQANYTLYPLAVQHPTAFHDLTLGNNAVQCQQGTSNCLSSGYLSGYAAGTGYDQASGLGSIDGSQLINSWNAISFLSTTTSLTTSATSFVHGTPVTLTAAVSASTGTPSGQVAVLSNGATEGNLGYIVLANGTGTLQTQALPGGSYQISGRYSGDGVYASSTSAPINITVTAEPSAIQLKDESGLSSTGGPVSNLAGQTLANGSTVSFEVAVAPASGATGETPASGTVTISDNGSALGTYTLDAYGVATFSSTTLAPGAHSLAVSYSGDASYEASNTNSSPLTFSVATTSATSVVPNVVVDAQVLLTSSLSQPQGVAVSSTGVVYVADTANNRVVTVAGGTVTPVSVPGYTLSNPKGVAVDTHGNLYIADTGNARIIEAPATGSPSILLASPVLSSPVSVTVDSNSNVYVGDAAAGAVYKVASTGGSATQVAATPNPQSLTTDAANNLYIGDGSSGKLYEVPAAGGADQDITPTTLTPGRATGLGTDFFGNLYILDGGAGRIIELPAAARTSPYLVPVQGLAAGSSLAVDSMGNLYLTDSGANDAVQLIYNGNTISLGQVPVGGPSPTSTTLNYELNAPTSITGFQTLTTGDISGEIAVAAGSCQPKNYFYNPSSSSNEITATNPFNCVASVQGAPAYPGIRNGAINLLGSSNTLLLSVPFTETGMAAAAWIGPGLASTVVSSLSEPQGFAISGENGTVYIADAASALVYSWKGLNGTNSPPAAISTSPITLSSPSDVKIDGAGDLFIADYGLGKIVVVPANTAIQPYLLATGSFISHPLALTFDAGGDLYISDGGPTGYQGSSSQPAFVVRVPPAGGPISVLNTSAANIYFPGALATDAVGNLYIADGGPTLSDGSVGPGQVVLVPRDGSAASVLNIPGLTDPVGLAFDPAGQLWILDYGNLNQLTILPPNSGTIYTVPLIAPLLNPSEMAFTAGPNALLISDLGSEMVQVSGTQATLSFPTTSPGSLSAPLTATITNVGNLPLNLGSPDYSPSGQTADFPIQSTTTCTNAMILNPTASCGIDAVFAPPTTGSFSATLALSTSSFSAGAPAVNLVGTGGTGDDAVMARNSTALQPGKSRHKRRYGAQAQ
jgi:sugar lactone lactonase YvrE